MAQEKRTLILGIGNYLMGDEGLGVHVARRLRAEALPEGVDVLDGGTGGFHLLGYLENYAHVILIDATLGDHTAGTIRLIQPGYSKDFPPSMSTHDIGLKDLISGLQLLDKMPEIDLIVVSIASLQQQGITLSPEIERSMPEIMDLIFKVLKTIHQKEVHPAE